MTFIFASQNQKTSFAYNSDSIALKLIHSDVSYKDRE